MSQTIRVAMQQSMLVKYRIPVFRMLAERDGIELNLLYGEFPGVPNVSADGLNFDATYSPFRRIGSGRASVFWQSAQWKVVRPNWADVAVLAWNTRYASLFPALIRAKKSGVSTLLWGQGYSKRESALRRNIRNRIGDLATAVMVYSHASRRRLIEEGWAPERVYVAQNAVDQAPVELAKAAWTQSDGRLAAFQKEKNLENADMVLYVSRYEKNNRVDLLLRAIADIKKDNPRIQAALIGKINDVGEELQALARELDVEKHVRFLGAIYDEEEIAPWFLSAKCFVYPANIGLSLMHAFGYGLPVVTGDNIAQHNPEIDALVDGENGLLFSDGDHESLARTLNKLIGDPGRRDALSRNAIKTVRENFTVERMVDGFEEAIRYCASQKKS